MPTAATSKLRAGIQQMLTLGVLFSAWAYGHHTHWTFVPQSAHVAAESVTGTTPPSKPGDLIEFQSPGAVRRSEIEVVEPAQRTMVEEVTASGVTAYDERVTAQLSTRVGGTVWRVEKHLGNVVRKGDTLAIVESGEVGRLKADFLSSLVTLESSRETLARLESVSEVLPERNIRVSRAAMREASIRLENAEQALVNLGFAIRAAEYLPLSDKVRKERILFAGLQASLVESLDSSSCSSNLLPLVAPFDGVIIGRDLTVGESVAPASPVFEIADVRHMWLILNVSKEDASRVAVGQPVRFRADGVPAELESTISWISTEVHKTTRTLTVRADLLDLSGNDHTAQCIRANLYGTGRIAVRKNVHAWVLPQECIHRDGAQSLIFVQTAATRFESRPIQTGLIANHWVEVFGDFDANTKVACHGSHVLKSERTLARTESGR